MASGSSNHSVANFLRGLVAILFALVAFFYTGFTVEVLLIFFGILVILDGIFCIATYASLKKHNHGALFLIGGIFDLILAMIIFAFPQSALVILIYYVAIWAIVMGILELWASFVAPKTFSGKGALGTVGVISIILGILMIAFPFTTLAAFIWLLGLAALIIGISLIIYSFQSKK